MRSINIASPGTVSFQGLGEPLRELREFVKDLLYRNRHERLHGELKLEESRLRLEALRSELGLQSQERQLSQAAVFLANGAKAIAMLTGEEKLDADSFEVFAE